MAGLFGSSCAEAVTGSAEWLLGVSVAAEDSLCSLTVVTLGSKLGAVLSSGKVISLCYLARGVRDEYGLRRGLPERV